ncbi:unnamed protein product, partial [Laminaria digitata]
MLANRQQQQQCSGTNGAGAAAAAAAEPWCGVVRSLTPRAVEASAKPAGAKALSAVAVAAAAASSSVSSSTAAAADAAVGGGGFGDRGARRLLSRYDNAVNFDDDDDDDNTTRLGSFRFPETSSASYDRRGGGDGTGARAGPADGRPGARNGRHANGSGNGNNGDGDADAGIEDDDDHDGGWEADSEAARTAAETPAAALAPVFEIERAARSGSRPGGSGARNLEPKGDASGGGDGGGLLERRGSMLDAYREPEGHDWDELEDWQGLPGLQAAGVGGGADIRSRLQAPALIFRSGTVNEGDVLSLHGRPRSRQPQGGSIPDSTRRGTTSAGPAGDSGLTPSGSNGCGGGGGGGEAGRVAADSRIHQPRPIRSGSSHAELDDVLGGEGNSSSAMEEGDWVTRAGGEGWESAGGGSGGGGGGGDGGVAGQPLLLSLADLTTAGLQKLLQAEGGSKMFFDPDAQRWVGEEVDLTGFEESLPGGGRGSSISSAAVALSPRFSNSNSPKMMGSASPRLARDVGGRRLPASAHRRWSSVGGVQVAEWERWGQLPGGKGAAGVDISRAEGRSHRRRRSSGGVGQEPRGSCSGRRSGGGGGGGGGGSGRGGISTPTPTRSAKRGGTGSGKARPSPVSRGSSAASSNLRSNSDTGSRQQSYDGNNHGDFDDGGLAPGASLRRADSLGRRRRSSYGSCGSGGSGGGGGGSGNGSSNGASPRGANKTLASGGAERISVGIGGEHRLTRSRLAQVFEGTALASTDCLVEKASPQSPRELKARVQKDRGDVQSWPSAPLSTSSSPPLGRESGQASESEMGASEMSDWDQDVVFEGLSDDQPFRLSLEQPAKFGYSPAGYVPVRGGGGGSVSVGGGVGSGASASGDYPTPIAYNDWLPPTGPELFRNSTAPATTASQASLGQGEAATFMKWPLKTSADGGGIRGSEGAWGRNKAVGSTCTHQRRGTYTDHRCDSLGSAAEWDKTLEGEWGRGEGDGGELDISLAQRPRTPLASAASAASGLTAGPPKPRLPTYVPPPLPPTLGSWRQGRAGMDTSSQEESPRSAVGVAWEAFKAHGGGHSLRATVKAAATATSLAVEHLRKRNRERLLMEKGAGAGKRLSGPVQITLEDLQASPPADRLSLGEGAEGAGFAKTPSPGAEASAAGAHFNREKMCWEGFEEPDLTGFASSDNDSDSEVEPSSLAPLSSAPSQSLLPLPRSPERGNSGGMGGMGGNGKIGGSGGGCSSGGGCAKIPSRLPPLKMKDVTVASEGGGAG